jgi:N-glycosylase/DNA lyase
MDDKIDALELPAPADAAAIFECGQCFRWNADERGDYTGVAHGRVLTGSRDGERVIIRERGGTNRNPALWREYFDLDTDYAAIRGGFSHDPHLARASEFGAGIRILRQEPWEALCSFIISQCNNIPRIKKIIETLCSLCGDQIGGADGESSEKYFAFPSAEVVAGKTETELAPLRSGYRAPYILAAAEEVASGRLDLAELAAEPIDAAMKALKSLPGVGEKVASCAALFGLHMLDAFPVDTWMKKAMSRHYENGFDPKQFSPYAGLAQQYLFYYERSGV